MDFGYALYETTVDVEEENLSLTIENVRYYAVVYADGKLQGYLKDSSKSLKTNLGKVRRAKLYYLRALTGKKARIKEKRVNG